MWRALGWSLVVAAGLTAVGVDRAAAQAAPTSFAPLAGQAGCLLSTGAFDGDGRPQGCGSAPALGAPQAVVVTPDGREVVFAGGGDATSGTNGVSVFARDAASGALSFSSCVTDNGGDGRVGSSGICSDADALATATGLAFSPDATAVYVSASRSSAVSWFSRDAETGALTQKGCIKQLVRARERCGAGYALAGAGAVAAHPDGDHVFVAAARSGAIAVFERNRDTGALTEHSCVSDTGSDGACARVSGVAGVDRLALSPDGRDLYATASASGAIVTLAFDATTGRLAQKGCLVADAPAGGPCTSDPLLVGANDVVVTADGRDVLVTADEEEEDGRLLSYGRDPDTGALVRRQCLEDVYESDLSTGCEPAHALQGLSALAVSADGRAVFTAAGSYEDSYVAAFTRDAASGRLAELGCTQIYNDYDECVLGPDIEAPTALAASPDARSLYVTSADNAVQVFGASIAIASRRVDAERRGTFRVRVECPQALREGCPGRLMVAGRRQTADFSVAPGGVELVRLALPARARRALRRHESVRVTVTALDRARRVAPTARALTVRRAG